MTELHDELKPETARSRGGDHMTAESGEQSMASATHAAHYPPILLSAEAPPAERQIRPGECGEGVFDTASFDAIEIDELFDAINHAQSRIGRATLYRSLARPVVDGAWTRSKQEALRELEASPELEQALARFVEGLIAGEKALYRLLYGRFVGGGMLSSSALVNLGPLDYEGYGYEHFIGGTEFAVDLVQGIEQLPVPQSPYLRELFEVIRDFGRSRTYALMKGPVYPINGDFLTRAEKPRWLPAFSFTPSSFKRGPTLFGIAALIVASYFSNEILLGAGHMKVGILMLLIPMLVIVSSQVATSDRDNVIYPLRRKWRKSEELARALDALGAIDELLSFRRYAQAFGSEVVLPEIVDAERHQLQAAGVRNPVLGKGNPAYVPNDIPIDAESRLLVITGPNSGGKTAYCKTVAQVQLLGQIGCYIPASQARLVPAERIFYQVPDPGRLEGKMGRFGHELTRTKEIFFNATPRTLAILDELGEGTTYEEKMAISEYILKGFHGLGASTLLVTHNHELCRRLGEEGMGRYLQVEFTGGKPTHRLVPGVSKVSHADRVAAALGFSKDDVEKHLASRNAGAPA